jgi:hypothetical protein
MKQTARLNKAQHNMAPGVITRDGMLGEDTRNLIEIILDDEGKVKRTGSTHHAIADRMQEILDAGKKGLGLQTSMGDHFQIRVDDVRGKLPCPFEDGVVQKTFVEVTNTTLGKTITFTSLHIHMIREHGFYEGKGATFRLKPRELVEILEVNAPGSDQTVPL